MRYNLRLICLCLFISLITANFVNAQNSSLEFWPETDLWYTINPSWRFSTFIPITKYYESKDRDLNIYLQADYRWGHTKRRTFVRMVDENKMQEIKSWMLRGGFMEGWSLGDASGNYTEDMLFAEIHKRFSLRGGILLSHRLRTDLRWVGQDPIFSYRFRYRIMIEKEFTAGQSSIIPYLNAEPYWDSRYNEINRFRLIGGTTFSRGKRLACEGNLTYQHDPYYDTPNVYALNIILHIFFEKKTDAKTALIRKLQTEEIL